MMNNPQTRILCVFGASALLMGTAAVLDLQTPPVSAAPVSAIEKIDEDERIPVPAWLLGEHDGVVAVFTGEGKLVRLTDSPVSALPLSDRENLAKGIPVADDTALAMLLEDYE